MELNFHPKHKTYSLNDKFYTDYPNNKFPEILTASGARKYHCFIMQISNYLICVPYRSEIRHNNCFHFKTTHRSKQHKSGLDYSKIVILSNRSYLDSSMTIVDQDEYNETMKYELRIRKEVEKYINQYVEFKKNKIKLGDSRYNKFYKYSTLAYFHRELGI